MGLVEVSETTRGRSVNSWVAEPQEVNRKPETFCYLEGGNVHRDDDSDNDSDDDSLKVAKAMVASARKHADSVDDVNDDMSGGDNCDDDCECISIGSFSDIEL